MKNLSTNIAEEYRDTVLATINNSKGLENVDEVKMIDNLEWATSFYFKIDQKTEINIKTPY